MKYPEKVKSIFLQIESFYQAFDKTSELSKKLKTYLLTQIFQLDSLRYQKECIGCMLVCCLENLNRISLRYQRDSSLADQKHLTLCEAQEIINLYSLIRGKNNAFDQANKRDFEIIEKHQILRDR